MSRKVIIASSKTNAAARISDFTGATFGDLKAHPVFAGLYGVGEAVECVVKPGNTTLRGDDSVLPTSDFNVFIIPTKNKAGVTATQTVNILDSINTAIKNATQIATLEEVEALKAALAATVNAFYNARTVNVPVVTPVVTAIPVVISPEQAELDAILAEAITM